MRKNRWIILAVFLVFLLLTLHNLLRNRNSTLGKEIVELALPDPGRITEIIIRDSLSRLAPPRELRLQKRDNGWFLHDTLPVKPGLTESILQAVSSITIASPVPETKAPTIRKNMEAIGIQVIFKERKNIVRNYLIYSDAEGNYIMQKGHKQPVAFSIPGFKENPVNLFTTHTEFWEDFALHLCPSGELRKIRLRYTGKPNISFTLQKNNADSWILTNFQGRTSEILPTSMALADFLRALRRIPSSSLPKDSSQQKGILPPDAQPFAVLETFSISDSVTVYFYPYYPHPKRSGKADPYYCLVKVKGTKKEMPVKYTDLDDLLCEPSDFQK